MAAQTPWSKRVGKQERLLDALVVSCSERGFEATSVANLLELSGVSRAAFYSHFENKYHCFEAMLSAVVEETLGAVERSVSKVPPGPARVEAALTTFASQIAAQPAAARACLLDSFAAGPKAREAVEAAMNRLQAIVAAALVECRHPGVSPELARATIGGVYKIFQNRAAHGDTADLVELAPRLAEWLLEQAPPSQPLRSVRRFSSDDRPPAFALHSPAERIMRALAATVAEYGYTDSTIAQIAARARVSRRTFYEHFEGKKEATIAALDASGAQMLAATIPAIRRTPEWSLAVRNAFALMCGFLAAEPDFARLRVIEAYAAGMRALEVRDRAGAELLEVLLAARPEASAATADSLLIEVIASTVYALLYECVSAGEPHEITHVVPVAAYVTLTPFIGAEAACEVANGRQ